jgi:serine protease AprX
MSPYYFTLSGTSMATPMVAGAGALLLQQNPYLTPDQLKARLMKTANKNLVPFSSYLDPTTGVTYNESADLFTVGAGYLDIAAALGNKDLALATLSAKSPTASFNSNTGRVTLLNGLSVIWDSSVIWDASTVWGSSVIWEASTLTGVSNVMTSSVVWDASTQAYSVIWDASSATAMSVIWDAAATANSVDGFGDCTTDSTVNNPTGTEVADPATVTYGSNQ